MEQMALPNLLFEPIGKDDDACGGCLAWLTGTWGCTPYVEPYVRRLFDEFRQTEAWSRSHVFQTLCGPAHVDGWGLEDAEYVGTYDHGITDYHVIWDRCWAIKMLVPRELVPKVWRCGYGDAPRFWDRGGRLLFESVYSVDAHVLSREERRQILAVACKEGMTHGPELEQGRPQRRDEV